MVERELGGVIVHSPLPPERVGAATLEALVVEEQDAGIAEQIRPDELVCRRVCELVDDEVEPASDLHPNEVMRPGGAERLDHVVGSQRLGQRSDIVEGIAPVCRRRTEPGDLHWQIDLSTLVL